VDRRTTIKWLAATMAAAWTGCSSRDRFLGSEIPSARTTSLLGVAATADDVGYGTDPDLVTPVVPWSRTMTRAQLRTSAALCDAILPADERSPAASAVGVPDFIDEWVSAPYPQQREDRELLMSGLEWLEQQSVNRFGAGFAAATERQQTELMELIATTPAATPELADRGEFFKRFRYLAVGAYYTSEAGSADVGYRGNVPIAGSYPGPSDEAMAHLAAVLDKLGLSLPG
jgi:hypothetical protein